MSNNTFADTLRFVSKIVETVEGDKHLMAEIQPLVEEFGIDIYNTQMGSLGVGSVLIERDLFAGINRLVLVAGCENCGNAHEDMICVQTDDSAFHYVKPERLHHAYND